MKNTNNDTPRSFYNASTFWIPVMGAVLLVFSMVGGFVHLYSRSEEILASITPAERRTMSVAVDMESTDYENNLVEAADSLYGTLTTSDGKILLDVAHQNVADGSLGSLIGSLPDIDADNTRYVLNRYKDEFFPDLSFSLLHGITAETDGDVVLTIDSRIQNAVYDRMTEQGVVGSLMAYEYQSGDTICLCTSPGWGEEGDGAYINRCTYATTPGSTMKLVTLILLEAQGIDTSTLTFRCDGTLKLDDGNEIVCTGCHGNINGNDAVGASCNCWFARAVRLLNLRAAVGALRDLGFFISETGEMALGKLPVDASSVFLGDTWDFHSIWSMIGQDQTLVSPSTMVTLAAAMATGGHAVAPRLTMDETPRSIPYGEKYAYALSRAYAVWQAGYEQYYSPDLYGTLTSAAKTGTADQLGERQTHKLLCAVSEELHTAVYVVVENYMDCQVMPHQLSSFAFEAINEIAR